jgi:hypothetical protein
MTEAFLEENMTLDAGVKQCSFVLLAAIFAAASLLAQQDPEALRKAAQNPVASLISFPIQENWNFNIGPYDRAQNVMNIQPVIPLSMGKDWNLITRWITPVVYQPNPSTEHEGYYGLGDLNPSFFISPKNSRIIWGAGPTFVLPTAMNTDYLGQGKFSIGPTAVVLVQPAKWTLGFLVNNVWSVAGHEHKPDVNQMLLQYFINYNLKKGWYLTIAPTITANWKVDKDRWVVPFGGGLGRMMKIGNQPAKFSFEFYGNAVTPSDGASWKFVGQIAFLFPKAPPKK